MAATESSMMDGFWTELDPRKTPYSEKLKADTFKAYGVPQGIEMSEEVFKGTFKKLTTGDKIGAYSIVAAPALGLLGAGAGLMSDRSGAASKYSDIGFQVGGILSAGAIVASPFARGMLGPTKLGGYVGAATTTMTTAMMQSDEAGFWQRLGVGVASGVTGYIGGGAIGKAISHYSKPITKVA